MAQKNIIDEKIEQLWARTQKWLEEDTFDQHMAESLESFSRGRYCHHWQPSSSSEALASLARRRQRSF